MAPSKLQSSQPTYQDDFTSTKNGIKLRTFVINAQKGNIT